MSITALNAQLALLRQLVAAVATDVPKATKAIADYDAHGGDTVGGGDSRGGDTLHVATGGGGLANAATGGLSKTGIRASVAITAAAVAIAKKDISDHVAAQTAAFDGATKDVVKQLIDAVAKRDKAQAEVLTYLQSRANEFYNGNAETVKVINLLQRWKAAQAKGDAAAQAEALRQLQVELKVINEILIGRGNTKSAGLDLDRLLGSGAAGAAAAINATNSATSTGKAP